MAKLGLSDCKWSKESEPDSFIASTIPKNIIKADSASHKTQRLWLEAAAPLAAIVDKIQTKGQAMVPRINILRYKGFVFRQ